MNAQEASQAALAHLSEALAVLDAHQCGQIAALHLTMAIDLLRAEMQSEVPKSS
jgi:hypothetical protein